MTSSMCLAGEDQTQWSLQGWAMCLAIILQGSGGLGRLTHMVKRCFGPREVLGGRRLGEKPVWPSGSLLGWWLGS